ncbi:hypothetical protein ZOSMA_96G00770 [Zostera marina]|uniref:Transmembrane protein n=1 Tax=Zostera marina TaxID=29655 RepID=A0A0K9NI00_ZOSMR|nr:hypothetical protein ZOSMA_96G00770 [Zostera marina]
MESIGAVICVVVGIVVLGMGAVIIGRLCAGSRILGYGHYDMEGWVEKKCSSCIDGRMALEDPPPPPPPDANANAAASSIQPPGASSSSG